MRSWLVGIAILALFGASVALQAAREAARREARQDPFLYVPSATTVKRLVGPFEALASDVYWIRAVQHYGGTKLSKEPGKRYDLLYPLLDITTTLDPRFSIAYRFGAIFLAEGYPDGPGRPDQAIALLRKGSAAQPEKWQYLQDIGFVHYWWLNDYAGAAEWFRRASEVPGAPWWLRSLAANTLALGGDRQASRFMWQTIHETADNDWLRHEARKRLLQLDALDQIDQLRALVEDHALRAGRSPSSWDVLLRAGRLRETPVDPGGTPYRLDPETLTVDLSPDSPLFPLPARQ